METNEHFLKRYINFIDYVKNNPVVSDYTEKHHIIPKSHGGSDNKDNIIKLNYRQHYIAHMILYKTYPKDKAMMFAFISMNGTNPNHKRSLCNSKFYDNAKKAWSKINIGRKGTPATKEQKDRFSKERKGKLRVYHIDNPTIEFDVTLDEKNNNDKLMAWNKGKTIAYDSDHNSHFVSINDDRLKSGVLISSGKYIAQNNKAEKNAMFSGYYITHLGKFSTIQSACQAHGCGRDAIVKRCKFPDSKITPNAIHRANDLNLEDHKDMINKTWKDLGYGFEIKDS